MDIQVVGDLSDMHTGVQITKGTIVYIKDTHRSSNCWLPSLYTMYTCITTMLPFLYILIIMYRFLFVLCCYVTTQFTKKRGRQLRKICKICNHLNSIRNYISKNEQFRQRFELSTDHIRISILYNEQISQRVEIKVHINISNPIKNLSVS